MSHQQPDPDQLKRAVVALFSCTIQTLHESGPISRQGFEKVVDRMYHDLRDRPEPDWSTLEVLSMTLQALRSFEK